MKKKKLILTAFILAILCSLAVIPVYAQSADVVWAEVERTSLSTNETLALRVYVNADAGRSSEPVLPSLDGFEVLRRSSGSQISIINGVRSSNIYFLYELHPLREGILTIDPIAVQVGGNVYNTEAITIEVSQGTGQLQPGSQQPLSPFQNFFNLPGFGNVPGFPSLPSIMGMPDFPSIQDVEIIPMSPAEAPADLGGYDFYAESKVDIETPFQGEQVTYTFRLYRAQDLMDQPQYQKPSFTGFWSHPESQQTEYSLDLEGKSYRVSEIQTILFPTVAGEVTIDPATITIPEGYFTRGGTLETRPINMSIQPLPAGAPGSFQGAVGKYNITAEIDTAETKVNQTVNLKVTLFGMGNIETLSELEWPESPQWRAFDSQAVTETKLEDGVLIGARLYERTLVPTSPGNFTMAPVVFSYFDPETESYHTTSTDPIGVTVAGDPTNIQPVSPVDTQGTPIQSQTPALTELRPIKTVGASDDFNSTLLTQKSGYWLLWIVPLLFLVGQFSWQQRQKRRNDNPEIQRNKQAAKKALREIRNARKNPDDAQYAAGRILTQYLTDKLNYSVVGQTQASLASILLDRGIDPALVERVQTCLMLAELGQYAPKRDHAQAGDLLDETAEIISQLEKVL
jgi:hypothetical protein